MSSRVQPKVRWMAGRSGGAGGGLGGGHDFGEEAGDGDVVAVEPAAVGAAAGIEGLEFGVFAQAVGGEVEPEDGAGGEASVARDGRGRDVEDAGFGGEDEEAVAGQGPAGGAQSVAVEGGTEGEAVGEGDGGGAVPGLHEGGVVFAEGADVVRHVVFGAPGLRDEHEHGVGGVAAGGDEELEDVVEGGGVGLSGADDGEEFLKVVAEEGGREGGFARGEGGEVAAQGVDFAVVRKGAEGVRQGPGGEGVGGVALVDDGEGGREVGVGEVGVEAVDLGGQEEAFVHDGARGAGADVGGGGGALDLPAQHQQAALEGGREGGRDFGFRGFGDFGI